MSLRLRLLRVTVLCCAVAAMPGLAGAQQPPAPKPAPPKPAAPAANAPAKDLKDPIVATVNGHNIRLSELEVAQQALPPQYRSMPFQAVFPALLERIVDSKLVVQEAKKNKVNEDPAFKRRMAFVEEQVIQDYWLQREYARKVTVEKLRQRYEEKLKSMPREEEVHARHILMAKEDEAKAIIAELKNGVPFDKLARDKSTDKASGAEGGDLGWFKKADMVPEFANAVFALSKGQLTEAPVQTKFGYHVIMLDDRRAVPPPAFEEMAEALREEMTRESVTGLLDQLRSTAKIEKFNIDGSKADGTPKPPPPATPARPPATPPGGSK